MKYLFFILSSILLFSCAPTEEKQIPNPHGINLNNGEKWSVNDEMKPHIEEGHLILRTYIESEETDYKSLAVELKGQNESLIHSCTMTGESHDELHKWLHPHMELLTQLIKEEDPAKANEVIDQIQASFENYHHYFK